VYIITAGASGSISTGVLGTSANLTGPYGLAFDGGNLLVLEFASKGILTPNSPGALLLVKPNGKRTVLASAGLDSPTGLAVGDGSIYISNDGTYPSSGPGPHGEVVSLPSSLGA